MMSIKLKLSFLLMIPFLIGVLFADDAAAADKKDKAAKRNAQMMQQMRQQFETEKASMQAEFDAKKKEWESNLAAKDEVLLELNTTLDATEQRLKKVTATLKNTNIELDTTKTTLSSTQMELETTQASLADLKTQHQKALADLAFNDAQRKTQATNLAETTKSLNQCVAKNEQLYGYGKSLVELYDNPSRYEAAMRKEKFLQLKRVELENILQDKLDKLDESRVGTKIN